MAKSRYADTPIVDGKFYGSFRLPRRAAGLIDVDLLEGVKTFDYIYKAGDRLDHLAARFLGDDRYWWIIALVNNIHYPFSSGGLSPGVTIKIPSEVGGILDKIMR